VQNPSNPLYHKWLTPKEFTERYGPTKADVSRVKAFLKDQGIEITNVSDNRILIHTKSSTVNYERAFGIRINNYKRDGRSFYSTTDRPKLPRSIAPLITNIMGLNRGVQMHSHNFMAPLKSAKERSYPPHVKAPPAATNYFNPFQIAHAYDWPDIDNLANGAGVPIAI